MYSPSDFRKGLPILVDNEPYYVVSYQHFKMGRGGANIRTRLKHIKTGAVIEKVFSPNDNFKPPDIERRKMQYLYEDGGQFVCPECAHEWSEVSASEEDSEQAKVVRDSVGNILQDGDMITVIKDLKVKGSSSVVKVGTKLKKHSAGGWRSRH